MSNGLRRVLALTGFMTALALAGVAYAGDWHVVGGDAYRNSDGEWVAWLSDGDGNHMTIKGRTRREARQNGENAAEIANATDCVDPCVYAPELCGINPNFLVASGPDWELDDVFPIGDGRWTAAIRSDAGHGASFTRSSAAAATSFAEYVADEFNAGNCVAF